MGHRVVCATACMVRALTVEGWTLVLRVNQVSSGLEDLSAWARACAARHTMACPDLSDSLYYKDSLPHKDPSQQLCPRCPVARKRALCTWP